MFHMVTFGVLALLVPPHLPPKPPAKPIAWSVMPVAIIRTAATILDPDRKPYLDWLDRRAGLQLLLRFNGPKKIRAFTNLHIQHAGVNTGADLHVLAPKPSTYFQPLRTRLGRIARAQALPGRILPVLLSLPSTKAKTLTRLAGNCDLIVGGRTRVVELKNLPMMDPGPVALPPDLFTHIRLKLLRKPKPGQTGLLALQIGGLPGAFQSAAVFTGKRLITHGSLVLGSPADTQKVLLFLSRPLSPDSELKLHLLAGQKTIGVKFSLRPIKLPH